jgi:hypothetical protein
MAMPSCVAPELRAGALLELDKSAPDETAGRELDVASGSRIFAKTPIHDQHFAERADHDVGRFQIAVQNSA